MNISILQIIVILIFSFFLFGDFNKLIKNLKFFTKKISDKNKKKGTWTLNLWFWKPTLYQIKLYSYKLKKI
nr:Sec-independent protein translocase component tatA/E [Rhizosolenia setigera]